MEPQKDPRFACIHADIFLKANNSVKSQQMMNIF